MRVVPAKSARTPGRIKVNFEDMEKNREEELKKKAEEEKQRRYDEHKQSFREAKRRSVVDMVLTLISSLSKCFHLVFRHWPNSLGCILPLKY